MPKLKFFWIEQKSPRKVEYAQSAIEKPSQHEEIKTDNPSIKETGEKSESHEVQDKNETKNPEYSWKIERLMNDERVSNKDCIFQFSKGLFVE